MAFTAGQKLTAAALNAAVGATWTTYTPTWTAPTTNPAIGNGILTGAWTKNGKTITVRVSMKPGSTTTYGSGEWRFALPETAAVVSGITIDSAWVGSAYGFDSGVANRSGTSRISPGGTYVTVTSDGGADTWRSTIPQTWANGDYMVLEIEYEAATF